MAIPRNLANLANQLNTDGEVPKIEVGNSSVEVTDTGSDGTITFDTDGSERMRINNAGQLMLGTTSGTTTLSVDIQNKSALSNNVLVQIKNTTNDEDVGLIINGLSSSTAYEYQQGMNLVVSTPDFCFRAITGSTAYRYYFGSTESVRINQYGIGLGAGTSPSSGVGITFPASQSASTDANTLDDYEEGTWTIDFNNGYNSGGTTTYTYNTGYYTKIGRQVTVSFRVVFNSVSGGSGTILIGGLPFTPNDTTQYVGNVWMSNVNTNDSVKNLFWGHAILDNASYYLVIGGTLDNSGMGNANCVTRTDIASGDIISGTLTYFV